MRREEIEQQYPDVVELYQQYGPAIVDDMRLAKNFAKYCVSHEVHWESGKKRLQRDFSAFQDLSLYGATDVAYSKDELTLKFILNEQIGFAYSVFLDEQEYARYEEGKLSESELKHLGSWRVDDLNFPSVSSYTEALKVLKGYDKI